MIGVERFAFTPAHRAVGFITRLCAAFVAAPMCAVCRGSEAEAAWVIDALGQIHGLCGNCAGLDDSEQASPPRGAEDGVDLGTGTGSILSVLD